MIAEISLNFIEWSLSGAIAGLAGAVTYLWKQQVKMHGDQIEWRDKRISELEDLEKEGREKIRQLEVKVHKLELEAESMKTRFLIFQSTHDSAPVPMWIKDLNGKVLAANQAYEDLFLKPRGYLLQDYVGHHDSAVWPEDVATEFTNNDERVRKDGLIWDGKETIINEAGARYQCRVIKYPRYAPGMNDPFGIAGIAIPEVKI